jgi:hypothetical protein
MILDGPVRRIRSRCTRRQFRRVEQFPKQSALPRLLRPDTIYVVGRPEQWLVFMCPCARAHDIALAIGKGGAWRLTATRPRRPTIYPSVNARGPGRRCHYWVTDGRVRWCADS